MPSKRMIAAAANYLAGATRCKETWEASLRQSHAGDQLSDRDLMEMHGAALGMVWATHTTDLDSALAILDRLEVDSATVHQDATDRRDLARRLLESQISGPPSYWTTTESGGRGQPARLISETRGLMPTSRSGDSGEPGRPRGTLFN